MLRFRFALALFCFPSFAETQYLQPPKEIVDVLRAPLTPTASVSPAHSHLLLLDNERYPPISEVAQPVMRLAGVRMNPRTNGPHLPLVSHTGITVVNLTNATQKPLALPAGARFGAPRWTGDGKHFAFTATFDSRVELWVGDPAALAARRITEHHVNAAYSEVFQWMPDNRHILVKLVPAGRGAPPQRAQTPAGPNIQESEGKAGPVRTYEDLLQNADDEKLFDYYAAAQVALVDSVTGHITPLNKPAVFSSFEPAPDGRHILVTRIHRPYSYVLPHSDFPRDVEVWDLSGKLVKQVASLPLAERVQIEGVRPGPRHLGWLPNEPATLVYVEALDGGNPNERATHRDHIVTMKAPFATEPQELLKVQHRIYALRGIEFLANGSMFVRDYERNKKWIRTFYVTPAGEAKEISGRSSQDRYKDPGMLVDELSTKGQRLVRQDGEFIYYAGLGASPTGEHPFLDRVNLTTAQKERLFQSDPDSYETVVAVISKDGRRILTRRESPTEPPNYVIREGSAKIELTRFTDPAPRLRSITKQLVTYQRADGVPLSFTLYLPPDYKPGTRLPTVVWAYPREYNDAETAGQVSGSTKRFTTLAGASHLFFLLRGYAVLDDAALPVVGDPRTVNNTYIDQIVAGAKAAIDKATEMGVTDPQRVGVGGHSYGAFMTANLLAHCDLFKAGIARSGAYNRTLTPFGFQSERRTLWEAPDIYLKMSPFMNAHKIRKPILLIHGEADDNQGTFPIQSDRMYQAIRGNGGTVRLVFLPHEAHAYKARESIEHTLAEMINWFDKYLK